MIIIMCDGACQVQSGQASIGALIWQRKKGKARGVTPVHTISEPIEGKATNNIAEYQALYKALQYSVYELINFSADRRVYAYTDSMLVVNQLNGKWKINDPALKGLAQTIMNIITKHKLDFQITWIPRQLTYLADKKAGEAVRNG